MHAYIVYLDTVELQYFKHWYLKYHRYVEVIQKSQPLQFFLSPIDNEVWLCMLWTLHYISNVIFIC